MTILLTIAVVFGVLLVAGVLAAIYQATDGDWPEPGE